MGVGWGALRPNMALHALTPRGSIPVLVQPAGTGVGSRRLNSLTSHDPILNKIRIHDPLNLVDIAATHFPPFRPPDSAPPPLPLALLTYPPPPASHTVTTPRATFLWSSLRNQKSSHLGVNPITPGHHSDREILDLSFPCPLRLSPF